MSINDINEVDTVLKGASDDDQTEAVALLFAQLDKMKPEEIQTMVVGVVPKGGTGQVLHAFCGEFDEAAKLCFGMLAKLASLQRKQD